MNTGRDDTSDRTTVREALDETLLVEAGAGSGKSTSLVSRIVELVTSGRVDISRVAAITFTEAAAAELRDRVREALERAAAGDVDETIDPDVDHRSPSERAVRSANAAAAVADIDAAAISTLHAFAQRLLRDHPLEAGLPPGIVVHDQLSSEVEFEDRWEEFLDRLYEEEDNQEVVVRALAAGVGDDHLHTIARAFNDNWDLVEDARLERTPLSRVEPRTVLDAIGEARAYRGHCVERDALLDHLDGLEGFAQRLTDADDDIERLELLRDAPRLVCGRGAKGNWSGVEPGEIRDLLKTAQNERDLLLARAGREALSHLLVILRDLTLDAAADRQRAGRLEFHDLLVLARDLLRHQPEVGDAVRSRHAHLLIDEFQDTDPIQAELAVRIATPEADPGADWRDLSPEAGRLFFVGDPKQAIYRFRRADIELFLDVRDRLVGEALQLTRSFRSVPGIIEWVNAIFGELFESGRERMQPGYVALEPSRAPHDEGPPVVLLGGEVEAGIDEVRAGEADEIARAVCRVVRGGWPVGDAGRKAELGDIAILLPARTALRFITAGLDDHDIPYRVEASSLVYQTAEVQEMLTVLRAVDDPTDEVSVIAALRSPLFGCGDDDLLDWHDRRGRWNYNRSWPDDVPADHPVRRGLAVLAELHRARWWTDVSSIIEEVLRRLRVLELTLDTPRPRDTWRRLQFVADQARAFAATSGTDLRRWLVWAELQAADGTRAPETVLPDTDDDAVRILTVHGSKGLEFPVVFLAGLNSSGGHGPDAVLWDKEHGRPEVRLSRDLATAGYEALAEREREMDDHERLRLLYVGATRARDHLVVSLHHKANSRCHAATLLERCENHVDLWRALEADDGDEPCARPERTPEFAEAVDDSPASRERWSRARTERIAAARTPRAVAPTTLARQAREAEHAAGQAVLAEEEAAKEQVPDPELAKTEVDPERPPWQRGRAGTSIGRAVHATLQTADLATGADLGPIAKAQAAAEGVAGRADEVERLARTALETPIVRQAVESGRFWREIYVGAPVGQRVLEGFVDLLVEDAGGYTVVDYKTDQAATEEELDTKVERYRIQGAAYALAVERTLDQPVNRCVFVFLRPDGAVEREVADLSEAKVQVERLLTDR